MKREFNLLSQNSRDYLESKGLTDDEFEVMALRSINPRGDEVEWKNRNPDRSYAEYVGIYNSAAAKIRASGGMMRDITLDEIMERHRKLVEEEARLDAEYDARHGIS